MAKMSDSSFDRDHSPLPSWQFESLIELGLSAIGTFAASTKEQLSLFPAGFAENLRACLQDLIWSLNNTGWPAA